MGRTVTFEVSPVGETTVLTTLNILLGTGGSFVLPPNVPAGSYDVRAKSSHWLRKKVASLNLTTAGTSGVVFNLVNGDIDLDNEIGIGDYSILSSQYGTTQTQSDLNGDGDVDIADYAILSSNYGLAGD